MTTKKPPAKPWYKKRGFIWGVSGVVGLLLVVAIAFKVSPWPGALLIRAVFSRNDVKVSKALEKHAPTTPITVLRDQVYRPNDRDARLDVYFSENTNKAERKPTIIWTHGGAWVSGGKDDNNTYYKLLAAQGFTVISVDYSLGPERTYPTAVHQLNDMHKYVVQNAEEFHVDDTNIFLAGDSAGAQLSSQMAALITNPAYAREVGIAPSLKPHQLKGVVLNCGIYKMHGLVQPDPNLPKIIGWGDDVSVWAYTGTRNFDDPVINQMSAYYHVTKDFPATYISGGNGDPLTNAQAKPFADKLEKLGVDVTSLFFADNYTPSLPHEYQFNLDTPAGQQALTATTTFVKKHAQ